MQPGASAFPLSGFLSFSENPPALISLDVFDTLLLRRVDTPAEVFEETARRARVAGLIDAGLTDPLFRLVRQEAERQARRAAHRNRGTEEVELAEIYRHVGIGDPAALMALELTVEAETLFANPLMLDSLRNLASQGCPTVLLSDMYLPPETLRDLLRNAGIEDPLYRTLYVSCAYGCSKRDGGLYRQLLADYPNLHPGQILHVGDDLVADVAMARAAGLQSLPYVPPAHYSQMRERERSLAGLGKPLSLPLRRLAALAGLKDDPSDSFWLAFGTLVLGPGIVEYCRWVVEDCQRRGIGLIAPLMREADLFAPLMRDWIRHRGYPITVEPLAVSRQAFAPLDLANLDGARARAILSARPHLPWDRLLRQAGGKPPDELSGLVGMTLERLAGHDLPEGRPALDVVLALFDAPELCQAATLRAAELRVLVLDYLEDRLGREGPVALVDLGARGSTPAAIAGLVPEETARFHAYLCYAVPDLAKPVSRGLKVSVFCGESDVAMTLGRVLYRSPQILERALTGLSGTTLGYRRDRYGRAVPETAPVSAQGNEAHQLTLLQGGIRRYAALLQAVQPLGADLPIPKGEAALLPLAAALLMPTAEEARLLGALCYDYNDGTDLERGICDAMAMTGVQALIDGDGPVMSMALGLRPLMVPWPQGALTRLDPGIFRRSADVLGLESGHGAVCRALVSRIQEQGLRRVAVVAVGGDGGMGADFIRIAEEAGLELAAYVDLMSNLAPPPRFHGVPVLTMGKLPELAPIPLVLVTLGYAERLAALLHDIFAAAGRPLRLIALGRPDLEALGSAASPSA